MTFLNGILGCFYLCNATQNGLTCVIFRKSFVHIELNDIVLAKHLAVFAEYVAASGDIAVCLTCIDPLFSTLDHSSVYEEVKTALVGNCPRILLNDTVDNVASTCRARELLSVDSCVTLGDNVIIEACFLDQSIFLVEEVINVRRYKLARTTVVIFNDFCSSCQALGKITVARTSIVFLSVDLKHRISLGLACPHITSSV